MDVLGAQLGNGAVEHLLVGHHVQTAFGGQFLAPLGHQRHHVRKELQGELDHLGGRGHFHVEARGHRLAQEAQVALLHVAAVLAQVSGDAAGTGKFRQHGGGHWIGIALLTSLAKGGDVIDVHSELDHLDSFRDVSDNPGARSTTPSEAMRSILRRTTSSVVVSRGREQRELPRLLA